jgi:hypothetical protein
MRRDYRASLEDIEYCMDRIRTLTIGLTSHSAPVHDVS